MYKKQISIFKKTCEFNKEMQKKYISDEKLKNKSIKIYYFYFILTKNQSEKTKKFEFSFLKYYVIV